MKVIKKLSDWKIWLFFILPIILYITWLVILIYVAGNQIYEAPLIISAQLLLVVGALLMFFHDIFGRLKQKHIILNIASILLFVCFLALQVAIMVMIPKAFNVYREKEILYEEYKETSSSDEDHQDKRNAWFEAVDESSQMSFTLSFMTYGSMIACTLACICAKPTKKNTTDSTDTSEENKIDITE